VADVSGRDSTVAAAYLFALSTFFLLALVALYLPGPIRAAVGPDGLGVVRLVGAMGLIGLLVMARWVNARVEFDHPGPEERARERDDEQEHEREPA
jgi:hypothetical protein